MDVNYDINHVVELDCAYHVDAMIKHVKERVVVMLFADSSDFDANIILEIINNISEEVCRFAAIGYFDISNNSDFNLMYEFNSPHNLMFFFEGRHILIDSEEGDRNKIDFVIDNEQDMIDVIERVFVGASKGLGSIVNPIKKQDRAAF
ncbi:hypothetical protein PCE1_000071 [Barthelona sp. PCE]